MKNKMKIDDKYEEDLLGSFEKGEWRSVPNLQDEIERYAASAAATLSKDKRINIRLSSRDLEDIQMRAAEEGMPYQTLIASVIHKYVSGRLLDGSALPTMRSAERGKKLRVG